MKLTERTYDTVTPEEWREASLQERQDFNARQRKQGVVSFCCLTCAFPTHRGQSTCDACNFGGIPVSSSIH